MVEARTILGANDNAVRTAKIDGLAIDDCSRRVQGLGEAYLEGAAIDRAARIAGIDVFHALRVEIHADFEIRNDLRAGCLGDLGGIADMIVMPMGEQNMGRARRRRLRIAGEFRVAGEERVDQDDRPAKLDAEGCVAEPNEFHAERSRTLAKKSRTNCEGF